MIQNPLGKEVQELKLKMSNMQDTINVLQSNFTEKEKNDNELMKLRVEREESLSNSLLKLRVRVDLVEACLKGQSKANSSYDPGRESLPSVVKRTISTEKKSPLLERMRSRMSSLASNRTENDSPVPDSVDDELMHVQMAISDSMYSIADNSTLSKSKNALVDKEFNESFDVAMLEEYNEERNVVINPSNAILTEDQLMQAEIDNSLDIKNVATVYIAKSNVTDDKAINDDFPKNITTDFKDYHDDTTSKRANENETSNSRTNPVENNANRKNFKSQGPPKLLGVCY